MGAATSLATPLQGYIASVVDLDRSTRRSMRDLWLLNTTRKSEMVLCQWMCILVVQPASILHPALQKRRIGARDCVGTDVIM